MKREILFRGKSIGTGGWLYGYLFNYGLTAPTNVPCICVCVPKSWEEVRLYYAVHPDTIGQYTGLKDKKGTKIFEGDILTGQNCRFVVKYDERQAEFVAVNSTLPKGFGLPMSQTWIDETKKVICGNIHDNPDLIK